MHVKSRHKKSLFFLLILLSISLSGCFQWAARAKNKLPNQTALNQTYSYKGKVLIIGAGAAGLAAAKVLEQNNIDYVILEASNCFGGRLKKDSTLADFPIDMGAEWIHSHPNALNVLKGKKATAKMKLEVAWNDVLIEVFTGQVVLYRRYRPVLQLDCRSRRSGIYPQWLHDHLVGKNLEAMAAPGHERPSSHSQG